MAERLGIRMITNFLIDNFGPEVGLTFFVIFGGLWLISVLCSVGRGVKRLVVSPTATKPVRSTIKPVRSTAARTQEELDEWLKRVAGKPSPPPNSSGPGNT